MLRGRRLVLILMAGMILSLGTGCGYPGKIWRALPDWPFSSKSRVGYSGGSATGERIVRTARNYLGTPYVYGGMSPKGFDCSGLTAYVYKPVRLCSASQCQGPVEGGRRISKRELQPGDLVFFKSSWSGYHVGIFQGGGRFIHAPRTGKNVEIQNLNKVITSAGIIPPAGLSDRSRRSSPGPPWSCPAPGHGCPGPCYGSWIRIWACWHFLYCFDLKFGAAFPISGCRRPNLPIRSMGDHTSITSFRRSFLHFSYRHFSSLS